MENGCGASRFEVLLVEDGDECMGEYCQILEALGYSVLKASDGIQALKLINENHAIGVVVTDVPAASLAGPALLEEIKARFSPFRSLIPVVITSATDLDAAVETMRAGAIDFLVKPVLLPALAAAMCRASAAWSTRQSQFRLKALLEKGGTSLEVTSQIADLARSDMQMPDRESLRKFLRCIVKSRQRRCEFMDASKFADPAWDIMLDLTSAALDGRSVPVLSATAASNVPITTGLRHLNQLVASGVVKRWDDPADKRRSLLALEDHALESMLKYLTSAWTGLYREASSKAH